MRKLRLELDALVVESFETAAKLRGVGTVHGARGWARVESADPSDCPNCNSADPCTGVPIDTCTCGCGVEPWPVEPGGGPGGGDTDCVATYGPCTCEPIETCSCAVMA